MKKVTQKAIKSMIQTGAAVDITGASYPAIMEPFEKVAYSAGLYGINGGVLQGLSSGILYAITARNANLFRYF